MPGSGLAVDDHRRVARDDDGGAAVVGAVADDEEGPGHGVGCSLGDSCGARVRCPCRRDCTRAPSQAFSPHPGQIVTVCATASGGAQSLAMGTPGAGTTEMLLSGEPSMRRAE